MRMIDVNSIFLEYQKMNRKEYNKLYHQRPDVIEKKKKYFKEYNARPNVKQRKHEEYVQKLIKEVQCQDIK